VPTGAVVDGRYLGSTAAMWVAGLWRDRDPNAANAPMAVHGTTSNVGRYMGLSTNPFSRQDAEREWTMIGQAALWATLTDEADSEIAFPEESPYASARFARRCNGDTGFCGTASGAPGPAIERVEVAVQRQSTGLWWNGSAFASPTPVYAQATGTERWFYAFPLANFPSTGRYAVRSRATTVGGNVEVTPDSTSFSLLQSCSLSIRGRATARQATTLALRINASGPRGSEQVDQPVRFTLRGAGVRRSVTSDPGGTARVRIRPTKAGTLTVQATGGSIASCRASVRVRRAAAGTAGTGAGLTGRP
jgi:hypothetical protein